MNRKAYLDIKMPKVKFDGFSEVMRITISSPLPYRRAVYKIATFFKREFGYDFIQYGYEGQEDDPKHRAFLWIDNPWEPVAVGATCFRWREWKDAEPGWAMQWIWLHPYFRGKGLLTKEWPRFVEEFGDFFVEPPLSNAMQAFLKKNTRKE